MENYVQINTPSETVFHGRIGRVLGEIDDTTFSDGYWVTFDHYTPPSEQDTELWVNKDSPIWPFAEHELIQLNESSLRKATSGLSLMTISTDE